MWMHVEAMHWHQVSFFDFVFSSCYEIGPLTEPGAFSVQLDWWSEILSDMPVSTSPVLGLQVCIVRHIKI